MIKLSENILKQQDEKPRIDPYIVMEDIIEKLRLLNYEICFCRKFKKEIISKYFFACNLNNSGKNRIMSPISPANVGNSSVPSSPSKKDDYPTENNDDKRFNQFALFYELSYWLINIIKQVKFILDN